MCRAKNLNMKTISNSVIKLIYIKQLLCFFFYNNYYILWGSFTNMCVMLKTFTSKQISNGAIIYIKQYLWYFLQLLQVYFVKKKTVPKTWIWKQYLMAPWYILNSKCDFFYNNFNNILWVSFINKNYYVCRAKNLNMETISIAL